MADNIIKRIIQMVLDKDSAKKTQSEVNTLTDAIDGSFKNLGKKIATYLSVGFLINGIKALGAAAIAQASESEKAWRSLKGTIDNTGASFDAMEDKIRATADAFQDATVHDDDAFAKGLNRLVSLTGDVSASLNNMGLVANVAAQFFEGDLATATDVVAKAMNGNTLALRKMGIAADDAQSALEILASRSMGAAEREAMTFDGQLKQLSNTWDDVLKDLGNAIIQSGGATNAFNVLRSALQVLGDWVANNREEISLWVTNGVKFAIDAADVFIRAITGMANILSGGFMTAIGLASQGIGKLIQGYGLLREIEDNVREKLGQDVTERKKFTKSVMDNANAMIAFGKEFTENGVEKVEKGIDRLSKKMFSSDQFSGLPAARAKVPGGTAAPQLAAGAKTEQSEAVKKAVKEYEEAGRRILFFQRQLGDSFDTVGAEVDRTTKLLSTFAEQGVDPASAGFADLGSKLVNLQNMGPPVTKILTDLTKQLGVDLAQASINGATSLDKLQIEAQDVSKALGELLQHPTQEGAAEAIASLTGRLVELNSAMKAVVADSAFTEGLKEMGETMRQDVFFAALDAEDGLARLQAQRQSLTRAIQIGIANNKTEDATFKQLVARYKEVTSAIQDQTTAMQLQATAADFLAEALGVALQGGIHEAAASKAKQTGIEALEWLVRAGAYALFGNFAGAGGALKTAASFGAVSLAWGALAASTKSSGGSSGGGGSTPSVSGGSAGSVTGGGENISSARDTASQRSADSKPPSPEVSVYLVGPGFDMLNPQVQRVVHGAQQQAIERYGANAKVRVVPHGES